MSALQKPIASGFNAASTADNVIKGIDLSGKIAIVTGGYSGLGLETARALHQRGSVRHRRSPACLSQAGFRLPVATYPQIYPLIPDFSKIG